MRPHILRDNQWNRIRDCLPGRAGSVGVTAADNRRFVDAVIHRYRTGIPWRDLPAHFGDWNNTHRRHSRWAKQFRGIATRYDKTATNFLAAFHMVAALCWLN